MRAINLVHLTAERLTVPSVVIIAVFASYLVVNAKPKVTTADDLFYRGNVAFTKRDMHGATNHFSQALELYKLEKNTGIKQARCHQAIGQVFRTMDKDSEAIDSFARAVAILVGMPGNERETADTYYEIGFCYQKQHKWNEAIQYQEKALALYQALKGSELSQADTIQGIGVALYRQERNAEAATRFSEAIRLYKSLKDKDADIAACYSLLGGVFQGMGKKREAIQAYQEALAIYRKQPECEQECELIEVLIEFLDDSAVESTDASFARVLDHLNDRTNQQPSLQSAGIVGPSGPTNESVTASFKQESLENATAIFRRGMEKYQSNELTAAVQACSEALAIYRGIPGTDHQQLLCEQLIGVAFSSLGKWDEAIQHLKLALELCKRTGGTESEQATCLANLGEVYNSLGSHKEAKENLALALVLLKEIRGSQRAQVVCQVNLGVALHGLGEYNEEIALLERTLLFAKTIESSEREQAACLVNIGLALLKLGKFREAIQSEIRAIEIYKTVSGTEREQARAFCSIGDAWVHLGKHEIAVQNFQAASFKFHRLKHAEREEADCHRNIGIALGHIGKRREAIKSYRLALSLYKQVKGAERDLASCHMSIGELLGDLRQYMEAEAEFLSALVFYDIALSDRKGIADCYMNLGVMKARQSQDGSLGSRGQAEMALGTLVQALELYRGLPNTQVSQVRCIKNIAAVLSILGQYEQAIAKYREALLLCERVGCVEEDQAGCHAGLGVAYGEIGLFDQAMHEHRSALEIYSHIEGRTQYQADCHRNIGGCLLEIGKHEEAIAEIQKSIELYLHWQGSESDQAICLAGIAESHRRAKRYVDAIACYQQAEKQIHTAWISRGLGISYKLRGEPGDQSNALTHLLRAVEYVEKSRDSVFAVEHRAAALERTYFVFPDLVDLLAVLSDQEAQVVDYEIVRWSNSTSKACRLREAAFHFADKGKGRAFHDQLSKRFSSSWATRPIRALASDQSLSQQLSKLTGQRLAGADAESDRGNGLTEQIEELQMRRNMSDFDAVIGSGHLYLDPQYHKPMEMAKEVEQDRAVLQYSVGEKEGWLLILTRDGVTAHKILTETPALPELFSRQEATIEQLIEAWKKRPNKIGVDGLVRLARVRAEDLGKRESERLNLIDAPQEKAILARLATAVLPDSALAELRTKGVHRLLVIPDGSLHYISFAMLQLKNEKGDGTHYLVEEFASSYVPAMTTLDTIRKQKKEREAKRKVGRRDLLAFANPTYGSETDPALPASVAKDDMVTRLRSFRNDYYKSGGLRLTSLPETEQEAMRVASLFAPPVTFTNTLTDLPVARAAVFVGKGAGEEQVKRLFVAPATTNQPPNTSYRYVLFSTHGLADTHNGMLSCLALSSPATESEEDGFLQAQEVMNLELDTDLVMLSACQTGLGRFRGGEGLVGLSAAFFYAGAESVCASLWQVPSGPTSQLVPELFKQLKEGKVDKADALRQAQLSVLRQGRGPDGKSADYSTPFCWAAFVLMGEYKQ